MMPRYYDGTTVLTGNGIGALRDAISCIVTEERNGGYELEMEYPVDGLHYESLALRGLIRARPNPYGEEQLFRIYKITRPLYGRVTVYAQHISYDLSGVPVRPCTASSAGVALETLKNAAEAENPFVFWTDLQTVADFEVAEPTSLRSALGGTDGSVLDVYGGEYEWDNYTVKLHAKRGTDRGVTIRYGKNLTDIQQDESCASVYTGVYPYWVDSDGNVTQISGSPVVDVPDGHYDFTRILTLDVSQDFEDKPTDDQLRARALTYIKANKVGIPTVSLVVSYAQLEQTVEYRGMALLERVGLCDTVRVVFDRLGVDAEAEAIKTTYNVLQGRYDSIELGEPRSTLAKTIVSIGQDTQNKINKTSTMLQQAVDKATKLITGNLGGYVVLHSSTGADAPDEILVMDEPDINTATRVWRWNLSGWGYSSTGYAGPYRLAATMDGAINADFITTGTLSANRVRAGVLTDATGDAFYLDLDKGILRINASSVTQDGKALATDEDVNDKLQSFVIQVSDTYASKDELGAYTKKDSVRSAFAMDASSITIESGVIAFKSNTITIDSDNFKLTGDGEVTAKGNFTSEGKYGTSKLYGGNIVFDVFGGYTSSISSGFGTDGSTTYPHLSLNTGALTLSCQNGLTINTDKINVENGYNGLAYAGQTVTKSYISDFVTKTYDLVAVSSLEQVGNGFSWSTTTYHLPLPSSWTNKSMYFVKGIMVTA